MSQHLTIHDLFPLSDAVETARQPIARPGVVSWWRRWCVGNVVVEVELPEAVVEIYGEADHLRRALSEGAVLEFVRRGEIDLDRGTELLQMHLSHSARLMDAHGIDYFAFTPEEWAEEVARGGRMLQDITGEPSAPA